MPVNYNRGLGESLENAFGNLGRVKHSLDEQRIKTVNSRTLERATDLASGKYDAEALTIKLAEEKANFTAATEEENGTVSEATKNYQLQTMAGLNQRNIKNLQTQRLTQIDSKMHASLASQPEGTQTVDRNSMTVTTPVMAFKEQEDGQQKAVVVGYKEVPVIEAMKNLGLTTTETNKFIHKSALTAMASTASITTAQATDSKELIKSIKDKLEVKYTDGIPKTPYMLNLENTATASYKADAAKKATELLSNEWALAKSDKDYGNLNATEENLQTLIKKGVHVNNSLVNKITTAADRQGYLDYVSSDNPKYKAKILTQRGWTEAEVVKMKVAAAQNILDGEDAVSLITNDDGQFDESLVAMHGSKAAGNTLKVQLTKEFARVIDEAINTGNIASLRTDHIAEYNNRVILAEQYEQNGVVNDSTLYYTNKGVFNGISFVGKTPKSSGRAPTVPADAVKTITQTLLSRVEDDTFNVATVKDGVTSYEKVKDDPNINLLVRENYAEELKKNSSLLASGYVTKLKIKIEQGTMYVEKVGDKEGVGGIIVLHDITSSGLSQAGYKYAISSVTGNKGLVGSEGTQTAFTLNTKVDQWGNDHFVLTDKAHPNNTPITLPKEQTAIIKLNDKVNEESKKFTVVTDKQGNYMKPKDSSKLAFYAKPEGGSNVSIVVNKNYRGKVDSSAFSSRFDSLVENQIKKYLSDNKLTRINSTGTAQELLSGSNTRGAN